MFVEQGQPWQMVQPPKEHLSWKVITYSYAVHDKWELTSGTRRFLDLFILGAMGFTAVESGMFLCLSLFRVCFSVTASDARCNCSIAPPVPLVGRIERRNSALFSTTADSKNSVIKKLYTNLFPGRR
jgi:hypothetical protein